MVRVFFKLIEILIHARTLYIHGITVIRDPTWLLVKYQSSAQVDSSRQLAKDLGLPKYDIENQNLMPAVKANMRERKHSGERIRLAIIIPFRDAWKMTKTCIDGILEQNLESIELTICLINNASSQNETIKGIEEMKAALQMAGLPQSRSSVVLHILNDNSAFNFSELNNNAVAFLNSLAPDLRPEYLLFLNNDTLFEAADALERLLFFTTLSSNIGAVSCTLLYGDSSVQHLFLAPGVKLAGAHPAKGIKVNLSHAWYAEPRPVAAVTGALLLISTRNFLSAKGFDNKLAMSCQDLDLCLKLQELSLTNWVVPNIFVKHFETKTRLKRNQPSEIAYLAGKWGSQLAMNKFYSTKLTRWSERPALSWWETSYPWSVILKTE